MEDRRVPAGARWVDAFVEWRDAGPVLCPGPDLRFAIAIPSRGRAEILCGHPLLPWATVYVHESEVSTYEQAFARAGVRCGSLQPHTITSGLPKIRNDMLRRSFAPEDTWLIMTDDDVRGMQRRFSFRLETETAPERLLQIIVSDGIAARDMGVGVFGFTIAPMPFERRSYRPFILRRWLSTECAGILDHSMRFDENTIGHDDLDFCLQSLVRHRIVFRDERFFVTGINNRHSNTVGGLAGHRSSAAEEAEVAYLQSKWGSDVVSKQGQRQRGVGFTVSVRLP